MLSSLLVATLVLISVAHATTPVIYGEDNRVEVVDSKSALFKALAAGTAAQISKQHINAMSGKVLLDGQTLNDFISMKYGPSLCEEERFKEQVAVGNCSGFLVAPDILVTAGHCYAENECDTYDWVFNYKAARSGDKTVSVNESDVYNCKEVIAQSTSGKDFAVIRLDRAVKGVTPLKVAKQTPGVGTSLVLIGHPSGLPTKIADGATVQKVISTGFKANVDSFGGNSGSAVFNDKTGEVVGILVNGATDYSIDSANGCVRVAKLSQNDGKEGVSGVEQFLPFLK